MKMEQQLQIRRASLVLLCCYCCCLSLTSLKLAVHGFTVTSSSIRHHEGLSKAQLLQYYNNQQQLKPRACLTAGTKSMMALSLTEVPVELSIADYSAPDTTSEIGNNPPVILLHGLLGSKRNFASLGTSLAHQLDRPRQVLAVDLRNHGDDVNDIRHDMSYTSMALDVVHVLDRLGLDKAVLVAHSMGGKVAQTMALLHPDRVAGLVVLDMAPVTYTKEDASWKAVQDIVHVLSDLDLSICSSKRDVDLSLRSTLPDPALRAFVLTNLDSKEVVQWKIPMQAIAAELTTLAGFDVPATNGVSYPGDAFFIHGGQSKFVRNIYLPTIADFFPNHMLTTIRGAGHWIHAEAPDDVIALLKRYLDR